MKKICFVYRHPIKEFFSIEKVFSVITEGLKDRFSIAQYYAEKSGAGISSVLTNILAARKEKADLYHITGDVHYLVLAFPKARTILTIHDCVFMYQVKGLKRKILQYLFLILPVRNARVVTTISEATKQDIIRFTGCSPDKIKVIPNPMPVAIEAAPPNQKKDKPLILFVGTTPNKNIERAIEALENIPCTFHVVGKLTDDIKDLLDKTLDWKNSVYLSEQQLVTAYQEADMVLFPSLFEGFGLPIIEAQKAGRPVVTSALEPMNHTAGGAARLIDPSSITSIKEGVEQVLNDESYRAELVKKGFENTRRFSPEVIINSYGELYSNLLSKDL